MKTPTITLYSSQKGEIGKFLNSFYNNNINLENDFKWANIFNNPTEMSDMIAAFVENNDHYKITMWISLDPHIYIYISESNADKIIRYLYERFPY